MAEGPGVVALPALQVDMADLSTPNPAPTSTTTTDTSIDQNVAFGKPLALFYAGAGKSVGYWQPSGASKPFKPFNSYKKVPGTGTRKMSSSRTRVAAFAALASDVFNFLVKGEFEPTLFSSLTEFKVYVDRDTRIARDQDDTLPVESLEEVCSSLLNYISSYIKDKRVKDKGIKDRLAELQRILSPGNDGTFPYINELWSSTSDSEDEDTCEDTDQDTNTNGDTDRVVADRRARHVCKLYRSLGHVFNVTECVDGVDNEGISIIKKRYCGEGCGTVLQEARHQQMREDMFRHIQEDWLIKYDVVLDPSNPQTLIVGPDEYVPASHRPNDNDENVSQEHIDSAEARWDALYQQSINKRKQEQGEEYNELFEVGDESSSRRLNSIEDYEKSIVSYL